VGEDQPAQAQDKEAWGVEIIVTLAYFFLVRLVFFDYKWLRFSMF